MMKTVFLSVTILSILILLCAGCGADSPVSVTINELVSEPEKYSGQTVTLEGIYLHGWEWTLLAEAVTFLGEGDSRELKPVGQSIWFAGLIPADVQSGLYQYETPGAGIQNYGKVGVTGVFEYGGRYGHMNAYKYRITASEIVLLEWTPPK